MFTERKSRSAKVNITYSIPTSHGWRIVNCEDLAGIFAARQDILARFWAFVQRGEPDACWLWRGNGVGKAGHGQFAIFHNVNRYAHRIAWALSHGNIPDGLKVCHRCDVPRCCNAAHLFLGTQGDNVRDAARKGHYSGPRRRERHVPQSSGSAVSREGQTV